jgi:hypothetical protein
LHFPMISKLNDANGPSIESPVPRAL